VHIDNVMRFRGVETDERLTALLYDFERCAAARMRRNGDSVFYNGAGEAGVRKRIDDNAAFMRAIIDRR